MYAGQSLNPSAPSSLHDPSYASTLLGHAQSLYHFATDSTIHQQTYQTAVPSAGDAYASSGYPDELVLAALFLALASNSSDNYAQAVRTYQQQSLVQHLHDDAVFNWDEKTPGAVVVGAQIASVYPTLATQQSYNWAGDAEPYFDRIVNGKSRATMTKGPLERSFLRITPKFVSHRRSPVVRWRLRRCVVEPGAERCHASDAICRLQFGVDVGQSRLLCDIRAEAA